jgi:hypothetical protein
MYKAFTYHDQNKRMYSIYGIYIEKYLLRARSNQPHTFQIGAHTSSLPGCVFIDGDT